ncbi:MAG: two-component sensor histidine kinase [Actinobacteria bacterium]|nr:two-component sensor histidine kinase [Actinomycetota bacterium]
MSSVPPAPRPGLSSQRHLGLEFPTWVPWLTLGIVMVFAILGSVPHGHGEWPHLVAVALTWFSILPWAIDALGGMVPRSVFAVLVVAPQAVIHLGGKALGIANLTDEDPTQMAIMILVFGVGEIAATASWRVAVPATVAAAAIISGRGIIEPSFDAGIFWAGGTVMALAIGYMMRRQAETTFQLREAQDALAREAVLQERNRIAREVHDVIAHSLTVTMMHLTAARMAVHRDPQGAESTLREAERLGRQSLADIRRTVGLLRDRVDGAVEPPQPDVRDLETLVAEYRAAGMEVEMDRDELGDLPASAGLALYRIVQESLTNAGKHAPGSPVEVTVRRDGGVIDLRVRNPVTDHSAPDKAPSGGMGILGMRERASLLGGTLRAGIDAGAWVVRCRFPADGPVPDRASGDRQEVLP